MPSAITRPNKNRRSRRLSGQQRPMQREIPVEIENVTAAAQTVTIEFNQVVTLKGVPQYRNQAGNLPTAATLTSPTTLELTYPVLSPVATAITVPGEDAAIRNASGGYVTPVTVDV